jgi:hypothetical protein
LRDGRSWICRQLLISARASNLPSVGTPSYAMSAEAEALIGFFIPRGLPKQSRAFLAWFTVLISHRVDASLTRRSAVCAGTKMERAHSA